MLRSTYSAHSLHSLLQLCWQSPSKLSPPRQHQSPFCPPLSSCCRPLLPSKSSASVYTLPREITRTKPPSRLSHRSPLELEPFCQPTNGNDQLSEVHTYQLFGNRKGLRPGSRYLAVPPMPHLNTTFEEHLFVDPTTTVNGRNCLRFHRIHANDNRADSVLLFRRLRGLVEDILARFYVGEGLGGRCLDTASSMFTRPEVLLRGGDWGHWRSCRLRYCHRNRLAI